MAELERRPFELYTHRGPLFLESPYTLITKSYRMIPKLMGHISQLSSFRRGSSF